MLRLTALRSGRVDVRERKEGAWTRADAERFLVNPGDFLVARGNGSLDLVGRGGLVTTVSEPVAFPDTMIRIRPDPERLEPRYLALAWNAPAVRSQIEALARTTAGIYKVNQSHLGSVTLPVPSLAEQRRVIEVLEDHLSRLDAADEYLLAALRRTNVVRRQVLAAALLKVESTKTRLIDVLSSPPANGRSVPTQENGFPVLRLTALRNGRVNLAERKPGAWTATEAARFQVRRGDFLISRGNGSLHLVGRGGLVEDEPDPVAYPDTLIRVAPDVTRLKPAFLALVWNAPVVRQQIEARARTTAGIYKVNQKDITSVALPVPSLADQCEVISIMQQYEERIQLVDGELRRVKERSKSLRRSLLATAFAGGLTEPSAPPATRS